MKGPRLVTQQKVLAETGNFIERFIGSGLAELGDKLGPVLWQFAPFKQFDKEDFGTFLDHLPRELDGLKLRSCRRGAPCELRHAGFHHVLRDDGIGIVYTDAEGWPNIGDLTGDVVYARLQRGDDTLDAAYPPKRPRCVARARQLWATGEAPDDLPRVMATHERKPRGEAARRVHLFHP